MSLPEAYGELEVSAVSSGSQGRSPSMTSHALLVVGDVDVHVHAEGAGAAAGVAELLDDPLVARVGADRRVAEPRGAVATAATATPDSSAAAIAVRRACPQLTADLGEVGGGVGVGLDHVPQQLALEVARRRRRGRVAPLGAVLVEHGPGGVGQLAGLGVHQEELLLDADLAHRGPVPILAEVTPPAGRARSRLGR